MLALLNIYFTTSKINNNTNSNNNTNNNNKDKE